MQSFSILPLPPSSSTTPIPIFPSTFHVSIHYVPLHHAFPFPATLTLIFSFPIPFPTHPYIFIFLIPPPIFPPLPHPPHTYPHVPLPPLPHTYTPILLFLSSPHPPHLSLPHLLLTHPISS